MPNRPLLYSIRKLDLSQMCIEAFAVGKAITILFQHEQVWLQLDHGHLDVTEVCDWFIRNDSRYAIDTLRLHFPYYIEPSCITVMSDSSKSIFDWYTQFKYDDFQTTIALEGGILDRPTPPAQILKADHILPAAADTVFLSDMEWSRCMIVDVRLTEAIKKGNLGWLRVKANPQAWIHDSHLVKLTPLPFLNSPHHFLARLSIRSPSHLRQEILERFQTTTPWAQRLVVERGWRTAGTLTRIEDHRVTVIYPIETQVFNVVATPPNSVVPVAFPRIPIAQHHALHFATGSIRNVRNDIVIMAKRVLDYIETVHSHTPPSKTHLVDRFGGDQHEVIGTFIDAMQAAEVLRRILRDERGEDFFTPMPRDAEYAMKLERLRNAYTFRDHESWAPGDRLTVDRKSYPMTEMRDLHPFSISFDVAWMHLDEEQRMRMACLGNVIDRILTLKDPLPHPRKALVFGCSEYINYKSLAVINTITDKLCENLKTHGHFEVTRLPSDASPQQIEQVMVRILDEMNYKGMFLFWFIGHGVSSYDNKHLTLLYKESSRNRGLEWPTIIDLITPYPSVTKIAVLDCCYAGLAGRSPLPDNHTFVWMTAEENDPSTALIAPAEHVHAKDQPTNFTWSVAELLEQGSESDGGVIGFKETFVRAHDMTSPNKTPGGFHKRGGNDDNLPFAINVAGLELAILANINSLIGASRDGKAARI